MAGHSTRRRTALTEEQREHQRQLVRDFIAREAGVAPARVHVDFEAAQPKPVYPLSIYQPDGMMPPRPTVHVICTSASQRVR